MSQHKQGLQSIDNSVSLSSHRGNLPYYQDNTILSEVLYLVYLMSKQLPKGLSIKPVNLTGETHQLALLLRLRGLPLPAFTHPAVYYAKKAGGINLREEVWKVGAIKQLVLSPRLPRQK